MTPDPATTAFTRAVSRTNSGLSWISPSAARGPRTQEEPVEVAAVRPEEHGLEAFDVALFLMAAPERDGFLEDLERELLAPPGHLAPSDEQRVCRHDCHPSLLAVARAYARPAQGCNYGRSRTGSVFSWLTNGDSTYSRLARRAPSRG